MKRLLTTSAFALTCLAFCSSNSAFGATYTYDFGTGTGAVTTGAGLPVPDSGTAFARVGAGGGGLSLNNPGIAALGTGSELAITASTGTSVNKFSIFDYTADTTSRLSFSAQLDGNSGTFSLFTGNGATFSNANAFTGAEVFTGLQFVLGGTTAAPTVTTTYRSGSAFVNTGLATSGILAATVLGFDIYGNNGAASVGYTAFGLSNTIVPNTFDIFLNGTLIGDDLPKALLPNGGTIDSFMVYGSNSTGNVGTFTIDNVTYGAVPEPSTYAMMAGAFGLLLVGQRIRRTARA